MDAVLPFVGMVVPFVDASLTFMYGCVDALYEGSADKDGGGLQDAGDRKRVSRMGARRCEIKAKAISFFLHHTCVTNFPVMCVPRVRLLGVGPLSQ